MDKFTTTSDFEELLFCVLSELKYKTTPRGMRSKPVNNPVLRTIRRILNRLGYDLKRIETSGEMEGFQSDLEIISDYTMLSRPRLLSLYECVVFCEQKDLKGDYVECGVWKGGAAGLMALANLRYGKTRRNIHLLDSFEGVPEPSRQIDGPRAVQEAQASGVGTLGRLTANPQFYRGRGIGTLDGTANLLERTIGYDAAFIHYHKGFFEHTVSRVASQLDQVAILHLDGDWYSSTRVCLEHFYEKVAKGGLVIIDDYGAYEGCRKAVDEFFSDRNINTYLHKIDSEVRVCVKL